MAVGSFGASKVGIFRALVFRTLLLLFRVDWAFDVVDNNSNLSELKLLLELTDDLNYYGLTD